ncbi:ShlB/FhaC/HecB family hemolysin secretion/activation protein, partial [Salmonella enterica]|nr:ShlB/FhaC/HecB family hemolysin secretion/activation protein [Salmonella enterica]
MKIVETLSPLTLLVSTAIWAAPVPLPNAGSLGNQLRQEAHFDVPAPVAPALVLPANSASQSRTSADNSTVVVIRQVHFTGDVLQDGINEAMLQKIIESDLNKPLTFSDLQQITEKITARYRQSGMLLARAILPAQTIHSGELTIQIVPGRYDDATVNNATTLRSQVIQHLVLTTTPTGEVIRRGQLERVALLLNEIPGVNAQVALSPGKKTGT